MKRSLSAPVKLAGFAVALLVVLAVSFGVARAVAAEGGRPTRTDTGHAVSMDRPGRAVRFETTLSSVGTYALYFDYQVDGVVRTATTTMEVA